VERSAVTTATASNVYRFRPALRTRETRREEAAVSSPTASAPWPFPDPLRPSECWYEHARWTKQLGRPLDAA
jgi:hypothetical protein